MRVKQVKVENGKIFPASFSKFSNENCINVVLAEPANMTKSRKTRPKRGNKNFKGLVPVELIEYKEKVEKKVLKQLKGRGKGDQSSKILRTTSHNGKFTIKGKNRSTKKTAAEKLSKKKKNSERRKEKSRDAARCRRGLENEIFHELGELLPLGTPLNQLDKASVIRMAITYLRTRNLAQYGLRKRCSYIDSPRSPCLTQGADGVLPCIPLGADGVLESVEGFFLVLTGDGDIVYVSDNISTLLGLSQTDVVGHSVYDYTHPCDHEEVRRISAFHSPSSSPSSFTSKYPSSTSKAPSHSPSSFTSKSRSTTSKYPSITSTSPSNSSSIPSPTSISPSVISSSQQRLVSFIRFKSTLTSRGRNVTLKSASYKVVRVTAQFVNSDSDEEEKYVHKGGGSRSGSGSSFGSGFGSGRWVMALAVPVPHPANIEVPLDKQAFISRHTLDMKFTYVDENVIGFCGYHPWELIGQSLYQILHALDSQMIMDACHTLRSKGQVETGQYRLLARGGGYVWVITQATLITGHKDTKPQYIVCLNYVLSHIQSGNVIFSDCQLEESLKNKVSSSTFSPPTPVPSFSHPNYLLPPTTSILVTKSLPLRKTVLQGKLYCPNTTLLTRTPSLLLPLVSTTPPADNTTAASRSSTLLTISGRSSGSTPSTAESNPTPTKSANVPRPVPATWSLLRERTQDMNEGYVTFTDGQSNNTVLKQEEPDDLTHLAPSVDDGYVQLEIPVFSPDLEEIFDIPSLAPDLTPPPESPQNSPETSVSSDKPLDISLLSLDTSPNNQDQLSKQCEDCDLNIKFNSEDFELSDTTTLGQSLGLDPRKAFARDLAASLELYPGKAFAKDLASGNFEIQRLASDPYERPFLTELDFGSEIFGTVKVFDDFSVPSKPLIETYSQSSNSDQSRVTGVSLSPTKPQFVSGSTPSRSNRDGEVSSASICGPSDWTASFADTESDVIGPLRPTPATSKLITTFDLMDEGADLTSSVDLFNAFDLKLEDDIDLRAPYISPNDEVLTFDQEELFGVNLGQTDPHNEARKEDPPYFGGKCKMGDDPSMEFCAPSPLKSAKVPPDMGGNCVDPNQVLPGQCFYKGINDVSTLELSGRFDNFNRSQINNNNYSTAMDIEDYGAFYSNGGIKRILVQESIQSKKFRPSSYPTLLTNQKRMEDSDSFSSTNRKAELSSQPIKPSNQKQERNDGVSGSANQRRNIPTPNTPIMQQLLVSDTPISNLSESAIDNSRPSSRISRTGAGWAVKSFRPTSTISRSHSVLRNLLVSGRDERSGYTIAVIDWPNKANYGRCASPLRGRNESLVHNFPVNKAGKVELTQAQLTALLERAGVVRLPSIKGEDMGDAPSLGIPQSAQSPASSRLLSTQDLGEDNRVATSEMPAVSLPELDVSSDWPVSELFLALDAAI